MNRSENAEARGNSRFNNFDLLRILSAAAVIVIHVNWHFFGARAGTPSTDIRYLAESVLSIVTHFAVPCFLMISGAFNLRSPKNRSFGAFYRKTLWKIFLPVVLALILLTLWDIAKAALRGTGVLAAAAPVGLLTGGKYNLWFMYMLAGVYLLTPLIVRLREALSRRAYIAASAVLLVWAVGSMAVSVPHAPYSIGVVFAFLGYYMMGDVILNLLELKRRPWFYFAAAGVLFAVTAAVRYLGFSYYLYNAYTSNLSPAVAAASLCVFAGFKGLRVRRSLAWLAERTFYIYLFHTLIFRELFQLLDRLGIAAHELVLIPLVSALTFGLSLGVSVLYGWLWKALDPLRRKYDALPFWEKLDD